MLIRTVLCLALMFIALSANACMAPLSHEDMITQSGVIVVGKLSDRKDGEKNIATATLTVTKVLKGGADLKSLTLSFQARPMTTASWSYTGTEEGVWFLQKATAPDKNVTYSTFHPNCLVRTSVLDAEGRKQVDALIEKVITQVAAAPRQPAPKEN